MKRRNAIPSILMACIMLVGCASNTAIEKEETVPASIPETIAVISETTEPVVTTEATEATEAAVPFEVTITPVITETQNSVTVTTADEFLAAIAPDTEIIVDAELIDFSKATGYGNANGEYYRWEDPFDGPELIITGVSNLTIRGAGEDHTVNVLSAVPRYAYVVMFENCSNIHVKGLTVGHTKEPGSCRGGVLGFQKQPGYSGGRLRPLRLWYHWCHG